MGGKPLEMPGKLYFYFVTLKNDYFFLYLIELIVVFCYYFFHEEAKSMGRWNGYQQPARTIE